MDSLKAGSMGVSKVGMMAVDLGAKLVGMTAAWMAVTKAASWESTKAGLWDFGSVGVMAGS